MSDIFPEKDREFVQSVRKFKDAVAGDAESLNISSDELDEMEEAVAELEDAYRELLQKKIAAKTARQKKDSVRKKVEKIFRPKARRIYSNEQITPPQIVSFGLRPHDDKLTRINAPDEAPRFSINNGNRLIHKIRFWEKGSERRRRKPKGVIGAEIWRMIEGEETEFRIITTAMVSPYAISYKPEDIGKQAHYYLIWITRRGDKSPPSAKQNATITG